MAQRTHRLSSLASLTECSFGVGKCVWHDEAEASRRCPLAKPPQESPSKTAPDRAEPALPAAPRDSDDWC